MYLAMKGVPPPRIKFEENVTTLAQSISNYLELCHRNIFKHLLLLKHMIKIMQSKCHNIQQSTLFSMQFLFQ